MLIKQGPQAVDFSMMTPISAIFVFHDPRNWALDIQIIIDAIQSRGIIDRPRPEDGATPVELIFCNPDLLWRSEFPRPRLGQGAFREAFQAVFKVSRYTSISFYFFLPCFFSFFFWFFSRPAELISSRLSPEHHTRTCSTANPQSTRTILRKRCCAHE